MVRPAQRRAVAVWAREAYALSVRRACMAVGVWRSSYRYQSVKAIQEPLRRRMREIAAVRVRAGYRHIHTLLRREGWRINRKRVYRLYTEEGLTLKRRRPKRHRSAVARIVRPLPALPNELWAMDFMHDTLARGESIRVLTVIDVCTRECVALVAAKTFVGTDVAQILGEVGRERGLPERIKVDNGTEFTSKRSISGRTGTRSSSISAGRVSPATTPSSSRSTRSFGESVSHSIGFRVSRTPSRRWTPGGRTTTTRGLTAAWRTSRRRCIVPEAASCRGPRAAKTRVVSGPRTGSGPGVCREP
jgi:integrase-like protein/helix-turn-helix protein